jgi:hypothetical protein
MKSSNTVVTLSIVGAVLVGTAAVGLLVHQARVGRSRPEPPTATEVSEAQIQQETAHSRHGPGTGQTQDSPEQRAALKEARSQAMERLESATEEQKTQFRAQVREQFNTRPSRTGSSGLTAGPAPAPAVQDPNAQSNTERTGP